MGAKSLLRLMLVVVLCVVPVGRAAAAEETLDDFISNPRLVQDVKILGLGIVSQVDPKVAEKNSAELRKSYWASRPESGLAPAEAENELLRWDNQWAAVRRLVQERNLRSLSFVGMDLVFLKKSQDWYFGAATPRGPVLIRVSVQYNPDAPMTLHGAQVWETWDEVKAATAAIQIPAGTKVLTVNYGNEKGEEVPAVGLR